LTEEVALIVPDFKVALGEAAERFRGFLMRDTELVRAASQKEIVINNDDDYAKAGAMLNLTRDSFKEEDGYRKEKAKPYDDAAKAVNEIYRDHLNALKALDKALAGAMSKFASQKEKARLELEAKLKKEAEDSGIAPSQVTVAATAKTTSNVVGSITMRDKWKVASVDMALLPECWKIANMDGLEKAGNESKGQAVIPGVVFEYAPVPATGSK